MKMVLGVGRPKMAMGSGSKRWNRSLIRGPSLDSPQTVKNSPDCLLDRNCPCEVA